MNDIKQLSVDQFRQCQRDGGHCIIDVRNPDEFNAGSEAQLCWPVSEINGVSTAAFVRQQNLSPDQTIVLLCASGKRAQMAADKLRTLIPNPIAVVQGGHGALRSNGATAMMSIERQVRIAAGLLVVLGSLAALLVNPLAVWLCLLVGAGLMVAGITDWCGMGLLMMKMPWNRR